jgi:hypothetical protein
MRKLIVIAAFSLISATAYAGPSRGLSLASVETTQPVTEQKADAKLAVPQEQPKNPVVADKPAEPAKATRRHPSTEARIIYELHRHGVYW